LGQKSGVLENNKLIFSKLILSILCLCRGIVGIGDPKDLGVFDFLGLQQSSNTLTSGGEILLAEYADANMQAKQPLLYVGCSVEWLTGMVVYL